MNKNKPHNFYKTWADSIVGQQLKALMDKCNEVSEQARLWAERQGATSYIESPEGIAGGIVLLEFENEIPVGFEPIPLPREGGQGGALPIEGSELEKEMYALPVVSETEFIRILQFMPRFNSKGKPMPITFGNTTPVCFFYRGWWYMDMPYECEADSLTRMDEKMFYRARMAALNTQEE